MLVIGYPKCSTCQNVEKQLKEKNISYTYRNIITDIPTAAELKKWQKATQLPIKRFFNTSGQIYRKEHLKDKLTDMSDEEKYQLLASNGMLIKRPILVTDDGVYVGADVKKYLEKD